VLQTLTSGAGIAMTGLLFARSVLALVFLCAGTLVYVVGEMLGSAGQWGV
jgi:hypothetical protein